MNTFKDKFSRRKDNKNVACHRIIRPNQGSTKQSMDITPTELRAPFSIMALALCYHPRTHMHLQLRGERLATKTHQNKFF